MINDHLCIHFTSYSFITSYSFLHNPALFNAPGKYNNSLVPVMIFTTSSLLIKCSRHWVVLKLLLLRCKVTNAYTFYAPFYDSDIKCSVLRHFSFVDAQFLKHFASCRRSYVEFVQQFLYRWGAIIARSMLVKFIHPWVSKTFGGIM